MTPITTVWACQWVLLPLWRSTGLVPRAPPPQVSLAQTLPSSTQHPNAFGIRWIQTAYLLFALVVPLAQLLILLLLWLAPLTLRRQKQWFVAAEVLNAWSALDVFIVSIIAALLQIRQFAQFIVGGRCDAIDALLRKYLPNALDGDPVCFDVVCHPTAAPRPLYLCRGRLHCPAPCHDDCATTRPPAYRDLQRRCAILRLQGASRHIFVFAARFPRHRRLPSFFVGQDDRTGHDSGYCLVATPPPLEGRVFNSGGGGGDRSPKTGGGRGVGKRAQLTGPLLSYYEL